MEREKESLLEFSCRYFACFLPSYYLDSFTEKRRGLCEEEEDQEQGGGKKRRKRKGTRQG